MIKFFRIWCEGILVATIISVLIEAILPEGNNKKYVKVVIGIYIIFTIFNPILGNLNINKDFSKNINKFYNQETIPTVNTSTIQELYINGIEETLKNNIQEELGYKIDSIQIKFDSSYENINEINIKLRQEKIENIEKVQINNKIEENLKYDDIKNYIIKNYEIEKNNINIY